VQTSPPAKTAPAKIEHPKETDIYLIVLTPRAEARLQISTVPVEKRTIPRTRTVGGEITIADGATIVVTAPLTGTLLVAANESEKSAGQNVTANQLVFHLSPLLSPEREVPTAAERVAMANAKASLLSSQIIAEGDVNRAAVQVEAAKIQLNRATRLFNDKVGSARDVDDAQARLDIARKVREAAQARTLQLGQLTLDAKPGQVSTIEIRAPLAGTLRRLTSSVGQVVTAGSPLFEVADMQTLWVRVPVYPGLRKEIASTKNALIRSLGTNDEAVSVQRVNAPPSADPLTATVDLFYKLDNSGGRFHPGERVEVILPMTDETESLVVPRAAILRDIHGIAWVYVNTAKQTFQRHRVEVHFTTDDLAVLSQGPPQGASVVVDGTAELFGTEFGAGK
jgi:RND family efflux transporter MFP subunit